jgi:nitrate/TMAO reductase-like tetraheme cytochrome c subunit
MKRFFAAIRGFFLPPATAPLLVRVVPLASIAFIMLLLFVFTTIAWEETNASTFCGLTCHTMPPEYITHQSSAHANVNCEDCHMGRDVLGVMIPRKIMYSWQTGSAMVTGNYEYPIVARNMRPARDACENCHKPEKFTSDKLVEIKHYAMDEVNTPLSTYLVVKTGGGTKRQGLGFGIHWHVENPVYFYATDRERQQIPYVVVTNPDGTKTEYIDVQSGFDPTTIQPDQLQQMDCITCHNRIAHEINDPANAVDALLSRGLLSTGIPNIKMIAVEKLGAAYASEQEAIDAMTGLSSYYQKTYADFYANNSALVDDAVLALQNQIKISYFPDQRVGWQTHPDNTGHINSAGCFRCHDGKHLTATGASVRLECNLCHSIPVVSGPDQIDTAIILDRGFEPETHKNSNWIVLHRTVFDTSCEGCHTVKDAGGTSNESFCSNSACHGAKYEFAGFNAPQLRQIMVEQAAALATATPEPTQVTAATDGSITWETVAPIFNARCISCHGSNAMDGVNLSSYATAFSGSTDGPILVAGDPDASLLIQIQSAATKHFGQLSASELETVRQWIQAGAIEK